MGNLIVWALAQEILKIGGHSHDRHERLGTEACFGLNTPLCIRVTRNRRRGGQSHRVTEYWRGYDVHGCFEK